MSNIIMDERTYIVMIVQQCRYNKFSDVNDTESLKLSQRLQLIKL